MPAAGVVRRGLPRSLRLLDLRRQRFADSPYRTLATSLRECRILRAGDVEDVDADDPDPFAGLAGSTRR